jgi:hypothetical protein
VQELVQIIGRRGGKGAVAAAIATTCGINGEHYRRYTRPGERPCVLVIAVDRPQARILHRYITANFRDNPMLRALVLRETSDSLELISGLEIVVATNSFRAIRGRTVCAAILDECAFYRDETSANPDLELYRSILPSTATIPASVVVMISSPYKKSGLLHQKWREAFGKDDPHVLVIQGSTPLFNETVPQRIIDEAIAADPSAASSEWLAQFRDDLESYVDRAVIESSVMAGSLRLWLACLRLRRRARIILPSPTRAADQAPMRIRWRFAGTALPAPKLSRCARLSRHFRRSR